MASAVERVVAAGAALGVVVEPLEFTHPVRTADEAAAAIGCDVSAIVKSLVFEVDGEPVVAMVPGDMRLDTHALAALAGGEEVRRAPLEVVRRATGYVAGGTPPFGHVAPLRVFADHRLRRHGSVWAGAGDPHTVFRISILDVERAIDPHWGDIAEGSAE